MNDVAWQIPLAAGNWKPPAPPDPLNRLRAVSAMMQIQQQQQQIEGLNALRAMYSDPANLDKTGQPTPDAMNRLMSVSPQLGMQVQRNILANQDAAARRSFEMSRVTQNVDKAVSGVRDSALNAYDDALSRGLPDAQARNIAQQTLRDGVSELRDTGTIPADVMSHISQTQFDPSMFRAAALTYGQRQALRAKEMEQARGRFGNPTEVRVTDPQGNTKPVLAQQDKVSGQWVDASSRQPLSGAVQSVVRPGDLDAPQGIGAGTAAGTAAPTDQHGDAYLKGLEPGFATQVKALAEGRQPFPTGFALRSPYWQRMLQAVANYDPSFDAVNYNARYRTRADFTSGATSKNITAINTAIGHLGTLLGSSEDLGNYNVHFVNTVRNWVNEAKGGESAAKINNFNTARTAVANELTRVFRGTGGAEADIKEWEERIHAAQSPAELQGAVGQAVHLLASRLDALQNTYQRGMGTTADVFDLLSPKAKQTLASLPGGSAMLKEEPKPAAAAPQVPPNAAALPKGRISTKAQYDALPSGTLFTAPDGSVRRKP